MFISRISHFHWPLLHNINRTVWLTRTSTTFIFNIYTVSIQNLYWAWNHFIRKNRWLEYGALWLWQRNRCNPQQPAAFHSGQPNDFIFNKQTIGDVPFVINILLAKMKWKTACGTQRTVPVGKHNGKLNIDILMWRRWIYTFSNVFNWFMWGTYSNGSTWGGASTWSLAKVKRSAIYPF